MKIQAPLFLAACQAYNLGSFLGEPKLLSGGLLHQIWRFDSEMGSYVLKKLNPLVIARPEAIARYRLTESIAKQFSSHVSLISALLQNDDCLFQYGSEVVMVFPYVAAQHLLPSQITVDHVQKMGGMLNQLHQTHLTAKSAPPLENFSLPVLSNQNSGLFNCVQLTLETFKSTELLQECLMKDLIISHRDCDPKNVLWDKNQHYFVIDWESLGWINKAKDLMVTAIYWSLQDNYQIDPLLLSVFLRAYSNANRFTALQIQAGIYGLCCDWLAWLEFNIKRSTTDLHNVEELNLAKKEVEKTTYALPKLLSQLSLIEQIAAQELKVK